MASCRVREFGLKPVVGDLVYRRKGGEIDTGDHGMKGVIIARVSIFSTFPAMVHVTSQSISLHVHVTTVTFMLLIIICPCARYDFSSS